MNEQEVIHTYWNGIPTLVYRGTAIIDKAEDETIIGKRISVVRIVLEGVKHNPRVIYLDDRGGAGWFKVTSGRGSSTYDHAEVVIEPKSFDGWL